VSWRYAAASDLGSGGGDWQDDDRRRLLSSGFRRRLFHWQLKISLSPPLKELRLASLGYGKTNPSDHFFDHQSPWLLASH
jgi:hypothetical protein